MMAASNISFTNTTIQTKFQTAIGRPLLQRCREISDLVANTSNKDLSGILPSLLENILGFGAEPGWGLETITKGQQPQEFEALLRFLGPKGPLLDLVYNLQTDPYLHFEFPFSCLPGPTKSMIKEGSLPMFYVNKLQFHNYSQPVLVLSAFELYMFHFCYALVNPNWQNKGHWNNMSEVLYPCLMGDYLDYFLPLKSKSLPRFPQSSSPVRSPLMQQQTPVSNRYAPASNTQTRSRSRLMKVSTQKQQPQASPSERFEEELWWSETLVQIIAEFWFHQSSLDPERGITPTGMSNWFPHNTPPHQHSFHYLVESFLPSSNHVRLSRLLLKHFHSFVNSVEREVVHSDYHPSVSSPLDEFKRSLLPSIIQKKLYGFLRHSFDKWPLDSSFRLVQEMWLTYIQPWRYASVDQKSSTGDGDVVHDQWFPFIRDNFLFYSVLFQDFLTRCRGMHLTSVHNAYIVFRVSKVFNLKNLPQLLREAEKMLCNNSYKHSLDLAGSYMAPEISTVLRVQISELEQPGFTYISMFGKETESDICHILQELAAAKRVLSASNSPPKKTEKSGLASLFDSFFEDRPSTYGDLSASDIKKTLSHLEQATYNFCHLYSLKIVEDSLITFPYSPGKSSFELHDQSAIMNQTLPSAETPSTPDCHMTSHGPQLTPLGRYQLMNGLRKFDVDYHGDPDTQPIRSFENVTLVRALHRLSSFINTHYQQEIQSVYSRGDLLGRMSQVYLSPPLQTGHSPGSPISQQQYAQLHTPRLTLRPLASYKNLLCLGVMYLLLRGVLGISPLGFVMFMLASLFMFALVRALVVSDKGQVS